MSLPATDAFTDTNGTSLTSHSASWTMQTGTAPEIQSNALTPKEGLNDALAYWNADTPNDNQYAQIKVVALIQGDINLSAAVRCSTSQFTAYFGSITTTASFFWKVVNGSFTSLGNTTTSFSAGDVVRIEASGDQITVKKNGSTLLGPYTDNGIASGRVGLEAYNTSTSHQLDDWEGGNLTGGDPEGSLIGGKLLRGGLLIHGVLTRG